jgi:Holliday junction resolvase-like predicted endonuclease
MRIVAAASHYLASKRIDRPARFDVVALSPHIGRLAVQWVKDAFQAS